MAGGSAGPIRRLRFLYIREESTMQVHVYTHPG
jgi:hypothetical protein